MPKRDRFRSRLTLSVALLVLTSVAGAVPAASPPGEEGAPRIPVDPPAAGPESAVIAGNDLASQWFDVPQFHAALGRRAGGGNQDGPQDSPVGPPPTPSIGGSAGEWPPEIRPVESRYFYLPTIERYRRSQRGFLAPFRVAQTGEYPIVGEQPWWNPYNTNTYKGDRPILGEHIFLRLDAVQNLTLESRDIAGRAADDSLVVVHQQFFSAEVFHGDTVFRPKTWAVRTTVATDLRDADVAFNGDTQVDFALQEFFGEVLIAEFDPYLDSVSARLGRQAFQSDFRNFLFADVNDGVRVFGTARKNRIQYDLAFFNLVEKDKFSNLNRTAESRDQQLFILDAFYQDAGFDGYTAEAALIVLADDGNKGNRNDEETLVYVGFFGDGRIGIFEVNHNLVLMAGDHDNNPIAGRDVSVLAGLLAAEVALPRDWYKLVGSFLVATPDTDANDGQGNGFDGIFDNPDFAGANFGFWHRQAFNIGGQQISNTNSLYPNLRTKNFNAPNSVNPGLFLLHGGVEATVSNFWAVFANTSLLSFLNTDSLEQASGNNRSIDKLIGVDVSLAAQYRPLGIDNFVILIGTSALLVGDGLRDTERAFGGSSSSVLLGSFVTATAAF